MVGVEHVPVVQVYGRRLVGYVERMVERQVPDRERLELSVPREVAHAVLVVYLREAGRELAGAGARRRDDDYRTLGLHVFVLAVSDVGDYRIDVGGIASGLVVVIDPDAAVLQFGAELLHRVLLLIARYNDAPHEQSEAPQVVDELQGVVRVRYAEVGAHLLPLNVACVQAEDDLGLVLQRL